ncbi:MAG: MFS transporter [Chloroflexi bacterium]|nr:MFS transporter [Chloroflexota bacterium]
MKAIEKQVVAYTSTCHALDHVLELAYGVALIGIAREFGVGLFVLGVLANIAGFAFGLTALPAGFLADRLGERRLLMIFCLGSGLASIGVALSPNIYVLGATLGVLGMALGIYHPAGSALVAVGTEQKGLAFGYVGVSGNLGQALGPMMVGLIASGYSWRAPYIVFAIPALVMAVLLYFFSKKEIPIIPPTARAVQARASSVLVPMVIIFLTGILSGSIYRGVVTFLPLYLSERVQLDFLEAGSIALAGSFTTVALIFGVLGQFLGGYLSERRRRETLAVIVAVTTTPLLLLMGNSYGLLLLLGAVAFALFFFMGQPVYNSLIADYTPEGWAGRSFGIYFFCSFALGSFSATLLGYIAERLGTNLVFTAMAGVSLLTVGLAAMLLVRALSVARRQAAG